MSSDVFSTFGDNDARDFSWIVHTTTACPSCNLPIFAGGHVAQALVVPRVQFDLELVKLCDVDVADCLVL